MDVLDQYKNAWDNQPQDIQKVSKNEILKLVKRRSSSIVKWIFIIGLLELIIPRAFYFFIDAD